jgi:hypothetical protein
VSFIAALLAAALFVLSGGGAAKVRSGTARFEFGRTGGNIAPFKVVINPDGTISRSGPVRLAHPKTRARSAQLLHFAQSQGFWSLPGRTSCQGFFPDAASRFVTIHTPTRTHRVTVRGQCSPRFARIYLELASAATVTTP